VTSTRRAPPLARKHTYICGSPHFQILEKWENLPLSLIAQKQKDCYSFPWLHDHELRPKTPVIGSRSAHSPDHKYATGYDRSRWPRARDFGSALLHWQLGVEENAEVTYNQGCRGPWGWYFNPHTHPIPTGIPIGIPIPTAALRTTSVELIVASLLTVSERYCGVSLLMAALDPIHSASVLSELSCSL